MHRLTHSALLTFVLLTAPALAVERAKGSPLYGASLHRAAGTLDAPDLVMAFHRNEREFSLATGSLGGIMEEAVPRKETEIKLGPHSIRYRTRELMAFHSGDQVSVADALAKHLAAAGDVLT